MGCETNEGEVIKWEMGREDGEDPRQHEREAERGGHGAGTHGRMLEAPAGIKAQPLRGQGRAVDTVPVRSLPRQQDPKVYNRLSIPMSH